ncbi:hypothetical protein ACODNH_23605 (plasmid) [Haloarcula sp. NS06]|uniref:hypothetical protein n=1 Tax=Haloarcula sp. NS06 TaxID=3409688 RepID=UPI003DA797F6
MSNNQPTECSLQPIPEEIQDISLEEIVEADYEVKTPANDAFSEREERDNPHRHRYGRMTAPGRVRNQDSIDASSEDPRGTDQGYVFTGYDTVGATRIGKASEDDSRKIKKLRRYNEGRHPSVGSHSLRESRRDKKRICQALCQSFPMTEGEREKILDIVEQIVFERFGYQKAIQRVVLGTVAVVMDEYISPPDTFDESIARSEEFRSAKNSFDISMSDLSTIKDHIRELIEEGEVYIPEGKSIPRRDPTLPAPTSYDEKPAEYWQNIPPEQWDLLARSWESTPEELKSGLPAEKRELIDRLRRWEPWKINKQSAGDSNSTPSNPEQQTELEKDYDDLLEEAEKLIDEMETGSAEQDV